MFTTTPLFTTTSVGYVRAEKAQLKQKQKQVGVAERRTMESGDTYVLGMHS